MQTTKLRFAPVLIAIAATFGLAACDKGADDRTAGQKMDAAVANVEQKSDKATAEIKKDMDSAKAAVVQAVDDTAIKMKDASITTGINAELTKDSSLSALKINVDTSEGKVSLRGSAPSLAAREQATRLAQGVSGVVSVDNQLQISSN